MEIYKTGEGMSGNHKLVLGFAHWGAVEIAVLEMIKTVEYAVANGIDEIDCAPHYGNGAQENILGMALLFLPEKIRSKIKISTKAGRVIDPDKKADTTNGFTNSSGFAQFFDYSKDGVDASFKQSQLRLRLPSVHALYLHDLDSETHKVQFASHYDQFHNSGYTAFDTLKKAGKIAIAGIGTNDVDACIKLIKDGRYKIDRIMIAGCYNLLNVSALAELFPLCKEKNIKLYIAAPYGGGLLSGQSGNNFFRYQNASPDLLNRLERIKTICAKFNVALPHAAMQFVHMHPQVERIVVGARTSEELKASLSYASRPITPLFWAALKEESLIPENTEIPFYRAISLLEKHGAVGQNIIKSMNRLLEGQEHYWNLYWMNSGVKLEQIILAINAMPDTANLIDVINDQNSALYKALNMQRISPMTFFGRLGFNQAKSLMSAQDEVAGVQLK